MDGQTTHKDHAICVRAIVAAKVAEIGGLELTIQIMKVNEHDERT